MTLAENDKNRIVELIKAGEKLPKEDIYKPVSYTHLTLPTIYSV